MKKILILFATIISAFITKAQNFPGSHPYSSPTTMEKPAGGLQAGVGLVETSYTDTTAANSNAYLKNYPGATFFSTSDNAIWLRNSTATKWLKQAGASGLGTVTSVGLSVPSVGSPFLGVSGSPVTTSGTLALSALGTSSQYVKGDGSLGTYGLATSLKSYTGGYLLIKSGSDSVKAFSAINGLTTDSSTNGLVRVKLGGELTNSTDITNSSGYDFKIHIDEDNSLNGFIGDNYGSFVGMDVGYPTMSQTNGTDNSIIQVGASQIFLSSALNSNIHHASSIYMKKDSMTFLPYDGIVNWDSLRSTSSMTRKNVLVWDSIGGGMYQIPSSLIVSDGGGWSILGNSGTTAGTNFIGTTDANDLVFKRNSVQVGRLSSTQVAVGYQALTSNTGTNGNVAVGYQAMLDDASGTGNVAVGYVSLTSNNGGVANVGLGRQALSTNVTGSYNIGVGYQALSGSTGNYNIGLGRNSGSNNGSRDYRLYINSIDRSDILGDTTKSIIYGYQDATASNQRLYLNSQVYMPYLTTGIPSGAKRALIGTDGKLYAADTTAGGGGSPSLTNTYIGYGSGGVLSGSNKLTWDNSTSDLLIKNGTDSAFRFYRHSGGSNRISMYDADGNELTLEAGSGYLFASNTDLIITNENDFGNPNLMIEPTSTGNENAFLISGYEGEVFEINKHGWVGIGVTPTVPLDVVGKSKISDTMTLSYLAANQLVATNASKNLQSLSTSTYPSLTELSYVKGVTSAIQTQFGTYLPLAGGTMTGNLIIQKNGYKPLLIGSSTTGSFLERAYIDSVGSFYSYGTNYIDPSNFSRGRFGINGNEFIMTTEAAGTGAMKDISITAGAGRAVYFGSNGTSYRAYITSAGSFISAVPFTVSASGAASKSATLLSGNPYTAGTATTNYPLLYANGGTAPTTWSTAGTYLGVNSVSGFTGNLLDFHINGGTSVASLNYQGTLTLAGNVSGQNFSTATITVGGWYQFRGGSSTDGIFLGSLHQLNWGSSTINTSGTKDVGIGRTSSGLLQVNTGTAGTFAAIESLYERIGTGSPEGVVTAPVSAIYHRTDGGTGTAVYFKESGTGNTGWVAK